MMRRNTKVNHFQEGRTRFVRKSEHLSGASAYTVKVDLISFMQKCNCNEDTGKNNRNRQMYIFAGCAQAF
jgi:hypothetical protein